MKAPPKIENWVLNTGHGLFGIILEDDIVVDAARGLNKLIGRTRREMQVFCKNQGYIYEVLRDNEVTRRYEERNAKAA